MHLLTLYIPVVCGEMPTSSHSPFQNHTGRTGKTGRSDLYCQESLVFMYVVTCLYKSCVWGRLFVYINSIN